MPFWVVCGIAIGCYYQYDHKPHTAPNYHAEVALALSRLDLIVQGIMAVGTIGLFILTYFALRSANKTAADALEASTKANKLTKRSVAAYLHAERPRIALISVRVLPNKFDVAIQNIGRVPTAIRAMYGRIAMIPKDEPLSMLSGTEPVEGWQYMALKPDGVAGWEELKPTCFVSALAHRFDEAALMRIHTTHRLIVSGYVVYDGLGSSLRRYAYAMEIKDLPSRHAFLPEHCFDRPEKARPPKDGQRP